VSAYDPQAAGKAMAVLPDIRYCSNPYEAAHRADAVLIVTEWDEFRRIDWARLRRTVEHPLIVDGRNMLNGNEVTAHGFRYASVGRPLAIPEVDVNRAQDTYAFHDGLSATGSAQGQS